MAKPSLNQLRNLQDFATNFRWDLQFIKLPQVGIYPSSEAINLRCTSSTIPKLTDEKITASVRGNKVHQTGIHSYDSLITLEFLETVDNTIHQLLQQWREACWNTNTGASNFKSEVEATILLTRMDSKDQPIWAYELFGCFLEDFEVPQLQSESSEFLRPSLTISYDYFRDNLIG